MGGKGLIIPVGSHYCLRIPANVTAAHEMALSHHILMPTVTMDRNTQAGQLDDVDRATLEGQRDAGSTPPAAPDFPPCFLLER